MAGRRNFSESPEYNNTHPQFSYECIIQPCGGCSELAEAEAQVVVAQNMLETARKRQAKAKTDLNLWHDRLVVRLPPEIVPQILIFVSYSYGGFEPIRSRNYADHPVYTSLLLARVCQRWRDIALATPQLWTDVGIDIWKHSAHLDITKELLLRSRTLPLNLKFYQGDVEDPWEDRSIISMAQGPILNLLRSHSARWKYLDFSLNICEEAPIIHQLLHNLESIPISDCLELRLGALECPHSIALPKPLRPRVFHSSVNDHSTNIPLQWDNLTHLDTESFGVDDVLAIVRDAPRLIDLTVAYLNAPPDPGPFPITPIIHHCLKSLTLGYCGEDVLRHLTLPSLQHLDCVIESETIILLDDLIDFLDRSKLKPGSLRTFRLRYDIRGEDYDHRFVELAALTDLKIRIHPSTRLQSYFCRFSEPSFLPHLRHLTIVVGDIVSAASWALLSDLCQDRTLHDDKAIGSADTPSLEETTSGLGSTADKNVPSETSASPSLSATAEGQCRRPLESLFVKGWSRLDMSNMEKDVLLCFLEVQKAGVVKLEFQDRDGPGGDVLKTMAKIHKC